jgi:hypothetical protein
MRIPASHFICELFPNYQIIRIQNSIQAFALLYAARINFQNNFKTIHMKKVYTFIMLLTFGSATFVGCSSSKNSAKGGILGGGGVTGTVVKTVGTVVGLIVLSKIIKSVLKTVGGSTAFEGVTSNNSFTTNFNEDTKLNSFAQSTLLKTALQILVAERFEIPLTTVANNYNSLTTVGDLATFIGKNGSAKKLGEIK